MKLTKNMRKKEGILNIKMIKIYTDGGSRGNPGKSACAFVAAKNGKVTATQSKFLGIKTNNEAEYHAVILALEFIRDDLIEIISDSELIIRQLTGEYKIKALHLQKLNTKIQNLAEKRKIKFTYARRTNPFIVRVDKLVNKELDAHKKVN